MIKTQPTPKHIESIKRFKKLLEKWDYWDYAYFDGSEYYFLTQYLSPINRISGHLILNQDGEPVPYLQAKQPFEYISIYNTIMSYTISYMLPQMKKDMSPFKERVQLLTNYRNVFNAVSQETAVSVDRIIDETNKTLENPKILNDIYYSIGDYQKKIEKEKGFFDSELFNDLRNTYNQYRVLLYQFGIRERSLGTDYDNVVQALTKVDDNIPSSDRRKIKNLLVAAKQSNQTTLEKSMLEFEQDDLGKKVVIDPDEIAESIQKKVERDAQQYLEEQMLSNLRNPK